VAPRYDRDPPAGWHPLVSARRDRQLLSTDSGVARGRHLRARQQRRLLLEASRGATPSASAPVVLADAGVENINAQVDELINSSHARRVNGACRDPSSSGSSSRSCSNSTDAIPSREVRELFPRCQNEETSASCSVAGGSTAALICDTGALLDYLVEDALDHQRFRQAIDRARTRYLPGLVLAEQTIS